jgi:hypothetical protein
MSDDPVATLRALADIYRGFYRKPDAEMLALADHIDSVIVRSAIPLKPQARQIVLADVRELLAVAEALGVSG